MNQPQSPRAPGQQPGSAAARAGKYLTFFLDDEEYGLEILKVQEIIGLLPITPVPGTPRYIRGVINLRGKIVPVMDLRAKFGMPAAATSDLSSVIVVRTEQLLMGLLVDRMAEVTQIHAADIEDPPSFGEDVEIDYLLGIGKAGGRVRLLLDIDHILTTQDVITIKKINYPVDSNGASADRKEPHQ